MKSMIDTAIDQCYECQVATKGDKEEPIKVTSIPNCPWDTVSIEQGTSLQGKNRLDRRNVVQDMVIAYRSTLQPATGVAHYQALNPFLSKRFPIDE